MIVSVWGLLRGLSVRYYVFVFISVFVPVVVTYLPDEYLGLSLVKLVPIFAAWGLGVLLVLAFLLRRDSAEAEQGVDRKLGETSVEVQLLREEHSGKIADLQEQLKETDRVMRAAFEDINVVLPPSRVSLRAIGAVGGFSGSPTLRVGGGSRTLRLRRWILRQVRRIWKWVVG